MNLEQARQQATAWAQSVLADDKAIILDTETTGLAGEIIQLGIIDMSGLPLVDNLLIKPVGDIHPKAQAVHGITAEMVARCPDIKIYAPMLEWFLKNASRVIVYNAEFDYGRINTSLEAVNMPSMNGDLWNKFYCAMHYYAEWYGEWNNYHQSFRWQKLPGGDHSATGDALATLAVIREMAETTD